MSINDLKYVLNEVQGNSSYPLFSREEAEKAVSFHKSIPGYKPTPLAHLGKLAEYWGLKDFYVKDESYRFGLNAFKVLGGSYAVAKLLCERLDVDIADVDFDYLTSPEVHEKLGDITFITATDGNHGRGIAWAAEKLKQNAVIYMPKGAAAARVKSIEAHGATCHVTDLNYDDAVRLACEEAEKNGWYMVQDTAWEGYVDIPTWIMQGYMTMPYEAVEQLGDVKPTHVFLQAGVGAMAGAVLAFMSEVYGDEAPITAVVEPHSAACLYESAKAGDGKPHTVGGDLDTIMAGLACGEPNPIGWDILKKSARAFISCEDYLAGNGMRILSCPILGDDRIIAGESGPVGIGVLDLIMNDPNFTTIKEELGLGSDSVILMFNTEGNTDPVNFKEIVWYGKYLKRQ
ncbi:diaminopropionate ammonia-lyase [Limisalsivibrio acetivorans]|uniref:diaminopropionate ammonia-lyase n=1 Tax=Limisalsivibrio acetivorans TaxID=1304888 RepID=UPI0003B58052|nr:diaminopropionate ammonia-lyase [Limisalsivibrio acetivorans]